MDGYQSLVFTNLCSQIGPRVLYFSIRLRDIYTGINKFNNYFLIVFVPQMKCMMQTHYLKVNISLLVYADYARKSILQSCFSPRLIGLGLFLYKRIMFLY